MVSSDKSFPWLLFKKTGWPWHRWVSLTRLNQSWTDMIPFSVKADRQVQLCLDLIRFQPSFNSKCPISSSCDPNSPILLRFSFKSVRFTLILPVWQSLKYFLLTGLVISGYKTVPKIEHFELDSQNSTCNQTRNHMFLGVLRRFSISWGSIFYQPSGKIPVLSTSVIEKRREAWTWMFNSNSYWVESQNQERSRSQREISHERKDKNLWDLSRTDFRIVPCW